MSLMFLDVPYMSFKYFNYTICLIFLFFFSGCKSSQVSTLDFSDGSYEGKVNRSGQKDGYGIYRWIDGSIYEGEYQDDLRHGKGRFLWSNGESYEGDYLKDERTGKGVYDWPDGSFYEGDFLAGKRHGHGMYKSADGTIYEGEWFDDLQHGHGTLVKPDGTTIKGIWRKGTLVSKPSIRPPTSSQPQLPSVQLEEISSENLVPQSPAQPKNINEASSPPKVISHSPPAKNTNHRSTPVAEAHDVLETSPVSPPVEAVEVDLLTEAEISAPEETKEKESSQSSSASNEKEKPDWSGTAAEAEREFITELVNGIDTVRRHSDGIPFSGRMEILDSNGNPLGEVNLVDGRLHGEEVFYNSSGEIIEKNLWSNGHKVGN
jgi:hypothetical protein